MIEDFGILSVIIRRAVPGKLAGFELDQQVGQAVKIVHFLHVLNILRYGRGDRVYGSLFT